MKRVLIVDEHDVEIGLKRYDELQYEDIYRVTALWLSDINTGEYLLTQRKHTKHNDPGKWMAAVSGTVEEGETYDINIVQEIGEEIGLTGLELAEGPKIYIDDGLHRFFVRWYFSKIDKDMAKIVIEEEEVEGYAWVAPDELVRDVTDNSGKYVPSMMDSMKALGLVEQ